MERKWVILKKLTGEWSKKTAESLDQWPEDVEGLWDAIGETDEPWHAEWMTETEVSLLCVVHGRVFPEKAKVLFDGTVAYIKLELWMEKTT